jgi:hypothetical protein
VTSTPDIFTPVMAVIPRLRKLRPISLEESASSSGSNRSSSSTIVTSTPKVLQAVANSMPTAPEPRMTAESGSSSRYRAWSEEMMRSPSKGAKGSSRGFEPVATTTAGAETVRLPSSVLTSMVWVSMRCPSPMMVSTPRPFRAPWSPFHILSITAALWAFSAATSMPW